MLTRVVVIVACALVLTSIWLYPGIQLPELDAEHPHGLYFLSTLAQSLAAVLALVFTVTLVIAQLSSQYSYRLPSRFLDITAIAYTALFVVAILLPIGQLTHPTTIGARVSFSFGAVALVLLMPYLLSIRRKLDPDRILHDLGARVLTSVGGIDDAEPAEARLIQSMTLSACGVRDYESFGQGLAVLGDGMIAAFEGGKPGMAGAILARLRDACMSTIDDSVAVLRSVERLREVGKTAVSRNLADAAEAIMKHIGIFTVTCQERGITAGLNEGVISVGIIAIEAVKAGMRDVAMTAVNQIQIIEHPAVEQGADTTADWCAWSISRIALHGLRASDAHTITVGVSAVHRLARHAMTKGLPRSAFRCIEALEELGVEAAKRRDQSLVDRIMGALDGLTKMTAAEACRARLGDAGEALSAVRHEAHSRGLVSRIVDPST